MCSIASSEDGGSRGAHRRTARLRSESEAEGGARQVHVRLPRHAGALRREVRQWQRNRQFYVWCLKGNVTVVHHHMNDDLCLVVEKSAQDTYKATNWYQC